MRFAKYFCFVNFTPKIKFFIISSTFLVEDYSNILTVNIFYLLQKTKIRQRKNQILVSKTNFFFLYFYLNFCVNLSISIIVDHARYQLLKAKRSLWLFLRAKTNLALVKHMIEVFAWPSRYPVIRDHVKKKSHFGCRAC